MSRCKPRRGCSRTELSTQLCTEHCTSARPGWHSMKALQGCAVLCPVLGVLLLTPSPRHGSTHTACPIAAPQQGGCSPGLFFMGSVCDLLSHADGFSPLYDTRQHAALLPTPSLYSDRVLNHFSTSAIKQLFPFIPRLADHEHAEERCCCRSTRLSGGMGQSSTHTSAYLRKNLMSTSEGRIKNKSLPLNQVAVLL